MADQPSNFACEPARECLAADVAKVQPDSELKNTLVLRRRIRIRVLDCRSGAAIANQPVAEVRLNDEPLASFLALDRNWDISKKFPIWKDGAQMKFGTTNVTLTKASQIVLEALCYNPGTPGNTYGPRGKTAFLKFRVVARAVTFKPEDLARMKLFAASIPVLKAQWQPAVGKKTLRGVKDIADKEVEFRAPTDAESEELIRIYNTKCYRAAQFHLASLDFYPRDDAKLKDGVMDAPDSGDWTEAWKEAFIAWQQVTFSRAKPKCYFCIQGKKEGEALMSQKRGFVTDEQGDIYVPIPVSALDKASSVTVGFRDFAVVPEATLKEYKAGSAKLHRKLLPASPDDDPPDPLVPSLDATSFSVEWTDGSQKVGWMQPWGWRCGMTAAKSDADRKAMMEFKTAWKFEIPAFTRAELDDPKTGADWGALHKRTQAFSMFYDAPDATPEFVLFGLVWCQPVWDGDKFTDPALGGIHPGVNTDAYVWPNNTALGWAQEPEDPRERDRGIGMHIVTRYDYVSSTPASTNKFNGKGYGHFEDDEPGDSKWRGGDGHHGIDVHARVNAPFFAIHAGTAKFSTQGDTDNLGRMVTVSWDQKPFNGAVDDTIHFFVTGGHLKEKATPFPSEKEVVMAGRIIGIAGRTGNIGPNNQRPSHVHLNLHRGTPSAEMSVSERDYFSLVYTFGPDTANKCCIPTNYRTPLLLPCRCETTHTDASKLENCKFGETDIVSSCWVVGELACPHMPRAKATLAHLLSNGANADKRQVQAQLRKLGHYSGKIDGDWGTFDDNIKVMKTGGDTIRAEASAASTKRVTVPKDTKLKVVGSASGWYKVEIPAAQRTATSSDQGWIAASSVAEPPIGGTRKGILAFKTAADLLPANPTPKDKYDADQSFLDRLNQDAPLISLT